MNITQKPLRPLLGIALAALLSNSVLANEQVASKSECGHPWSKEQQKDGYGAHFDKRMSALHDALKLTTGQEAAWAEFSNKMKPVKTDKPGYQDRKDMSAPDRLDRMLDNMKSHEKIMAGHAATVRAFYETLNQDQKKIFDKHFQEHHDRSGRHLHDN